jgi:hypothetical protein
MEEILKSTKAELNDDFHRFNQLPDYINYTVYRHINLHRFMQNKHSDGEEVLTKHTPKSALVFLPPVKSIVDA